MATLSFGTGRNHAEVTARALLALRETLFIRVPRLVHASAAGGCGFGSAAVRRGVWPRGAGRTLRASGICRRCAHSAGPLPRIAFLVWDTHVQFSLLRLSLRSGDPKETFAARRALRVGLGVTLGLGPFTLLACGVNDAHAGLLFTFVIAGGFLGAEPAFAACYTHRVGVVGPRTFRPFTGVTQFMAYGVVWRLNLRDISAVQSWSGIGLGLTDG